MKNHLQISLYIAIPVAFCMGCTRGDSLPQEPDTVEPAIVSSAQVPATRTPGVYVLTRAGNKDATEAAIAQIREIGVKLTDAWEPLDESICASPTTVGLIIELASPDSRVAQFGFTQGTGQERVFCNPMWYHYNYSGATP